MGRWLGSLEEPCSWEPGGIWAWPWFADMRVGTESDYREMGFPLVALAAMLARAVVGWREREKEKRERESWTFCWPFFLSVALQSGRDDDGPRHGHVTMVVRHLAMEEH